MAVLWVCFATAYLLVEVAAAVMVWAYEDTRTPVEVLRYRRGGGRR